METVRDDDDEGGNSEDEDGENEDGSGDGGGGTTQTETGSQFLLHNSTSEEDRVKGGRYPDCNVSSRWVCALQQHHSLKVLPGTDKNPRAL